MEGPSARDKRLWDELMGGEPADHWMDYCSLVDVFPVQIDEAATVEGAAREIVDLYPGLEHILQREKMTREQLYRAFLRVLQSVVPPEVEFTTAATVSEMIDTLDRVRQRHGLDHVGWGVGNLYGDDMLHVLATDSSRSVSVYTGNGTDLAYRVAQIERAYW